MATIKVKAIAKKGVIELGFSWIFILLAGVAILSLFSYIGVKQGVFFTDKLHGRLLIDLSSIFIGSQVSRNTAAIVDIPESEIRFECDGFKTGRTSYPFNGFAVFAPAKIKGSKLITWSRGWGVGFRVMNFLYITSPTVKYYILYNGSANSRNLALKLYQEFPDVKIEDYSKNKEIGCISAGGTGICTGSDILRIKNEGFSRVNVLVIGYGPNNNLLLNNYNANDFRSHALDEVSFIYVTNVAELSDDIFAADISFKNKNQAYVAMDPNLPTQYTQRFVDKSTVFGAWISGNPTLFQCMMERAYRHATPVSEIYSRRTAALGSATRPICQTFYSTQGIPTINAIRNQLSGGIVSADVLTTKQLEMSQLNNQLERTSCPQLY